MPEGINRLVVIGLGLIGSSLAKAARDRGLCQEVIGCSRSPETLVKAMKAGVVDRVVGSIEAVAGELGDGDLVVIGVPTLTV
ncbi:MAG: NAD(P)-binding domain-containing protein, partial [Porticoccus sp.]|nr:NAD(P)-binding domain-containing protein [Porticoccus sp.]